MSLSEIFLVGIGLSMDAFAVSVGKGLGMRKLNVAMAFELACAFGLFQALMPVGGWLLASTFAHAVQAYSHWVAFILLATIGLKMAYDAIQGESDMPTNSATIVGIGELVLLAVATSIDAFAVGITFSTLGVPLLPGVAIIGVTTFAFSFTGCVAGSIIGERGERVAGIIGGVILVAIGVKVLIEGLL